MVNRDYAPMLRQLDVAKHQKNAVAMFFLAIMIFSIVLIQVVRGESILQQLAMGVLGTVCFASMIGLAYLMMKDMISEFF